MNMYLQDFQLAQQVMVMVDIFGFVVSSNWPSYVLKCHVACWCGAIVVSSSFSSVLYEKFKGSGTTEGKV